MTPSPPQLADTAVNPILPPLGANPYVGPRPFKFGEAIFGRTDEIRDLFYRLNAERIVMLHSPSGAGKSSLVAAGLLPRLKQEEFDVWPIIRVNQEPPPGNPANRYVFSTLVSLDEDLPDALRKDGLALGSLTVAQYVATRPRRRGAPPNVMLIFDQFEEVLTIDPVALEAKREFFRQIGELLRDRQYWALFIIREDFLAPFDPYAPLVPTQFKNRFRLDLLSLDAARKAIEEPAKKSGRVYGPGVADKLIHDLAEVLVEQPSGEPVKQSGNYVEPVQLQVVCKRLWDQLPEQDRSVDLDDLKIFGDDYVSQALGAYYDSAVAHAAGGDPAQKPPKLPDPVLERAIRQWFGDALIISGRIRGQVMQGVRTTAGLDNDVIQKLLDTHLIRGEKRRGATWYELAHDRLIRPVCTSNEAWLQRNLDPFQWRAAFWQQNGHSEALLLADPDLLQAEMRVRQSGMRITDVESRFLQEARARETKLMQARMEKRKKRRAYWILAALILIGSLASLIWIGNESENARFSERNRELFFKVLQKTKFRVQDLFEYDQSRASGEVKPLDAKDKDWVALIKQNEHPFAIARSYEGGRILAVGHDGFLSHQDADGERLFLEIALTWLEGDRTSKKIVFSKGHEEVFNRESYQADRDLLEAKLQSADWEYHVDQAGNLADTSVLNSQVDILVIGNAWEKFTPDEVEAVKTFVADGGGLLVVGLGWEWQVNHPKSSLDDYPMNQLLKDFGAKWTSSKMQAEAGQ